MITQAQVNQLMQMNANNLPKEVLPNFETIKSILEITNDVNELNDLGIEKDFTTFFKGYDKFVPAPKMTTSSTAKKAQAKPVAPTATTQQRASAKMQGNALSKEKAKQKQKQILEVSVVEKYDLVKQNARFKNDIGEELTAYLKENVPRLGLGGLPIDYEIEQLKAKDKFYSNLLKGDSADFKAIAKRLGLTFTDRGAAARASAVKKGISKAQPKTKTDNKSIWSWLK
jgi:hypothetical protein